MAARGALWARRPVARTAVRRHRAVLPLHGADIRRVRVGPRHGERRARSHGRARAGPLHAVRQRPGRLDPRQGPSRRRRVRAPPLRRRLVFGRARDARPGQRVEARVPQALAADRSRRLLHPSRRLALLVAHVSPRLQRRRRRRVEGRFSGVPRPRRERRLLGDRELPHRSRQGGRGGRARHARRALRHDELRRAHAPCGRVAVGPRATRGGRRGRCAHEGGAGVPLPHRIGVDAGTDGGGVARHVHDGASHGGARAPRLGAAGVSSLRALGAQLARGRGRRARRGLGLGGPLADPGFHASPGARGVGRDAVATAAGARRAESSTS